MASLVSKLKKKWQCGFKGITKNNWISLRNALINNFNRLALRDDVGMLWENFVFSERLKRNTYLRHYANYYFWRTYSKQEIDFIEEYDGKLYGYEFTSGKKRKKPPRLWLNTYPNASFTAITPDNFLDFVASEREMSLR